MTKNSAQKSKTGAGCAAADGIFKTLEMQMKKVFREAVRATRGEMSAQTHFRHRDSMAVFLRFCAEQFRLQKIQNIKNKHLRAYIDWRRENGITEKTIKQDLSAIRFFHRFAGAGSKLAPNEVLGLGHTPAGKADRAWTPEEYARMLRLAQELNRRDVALTMQLARWMGLRIHECTRLSRDDAERALQSGVLEVKGKGGKVRNVPVRPEAADALRQACEGLERNEKLFVPEGGKTHRIIGRIKDFIYRHRNKVTGDEREAGITFHGLRHLYAQNRMREARGRLGERGALLEVAQLLGHGRGEITRVYLGGKRRE
jgi:site-specific recombinase XerC